MVASWSRALVCLAWLGACAAPGPSHGGGVVAAPMPDGGAPSGPADSVTPPGASSDGGSTTDAGNTTDAGSSGPPYSLQANRDRLIGDLAQRKSTDACKLWASLNLAERYIFLMDTAYLAAGASRLHPSTANLETALDHAVALYSINGPMAGQGVDGSGRGGQDYNRIYLGFDAQAESAMRNFAAVGNQWVQSDDLAGPHPPFTQREMIFWYKAFTDLSSNGPQFHHWHSDADFTQSGIDQRLGVCGVSDPSLTELTIAFDFYHNSDPLGDYAGRGGFGWQIVDQHLDIAADWNYTPGSCAPSPPVNSDPYGGGTFAGMGPSLQNGVCH